jgi:hypothetical protein
VYGGGDTTAATSIDKEHIVGIGVSVFLMAVGAVMTFALEADADGINLDTVGIILMVVGALGLLVSLLFWRDAAPWARGRTVVREEHLL